MLEKNKNNNLSDLFLYNSYKNDFNNFLSVRNKLKTNKLNVFEDKNSQINIYKSRNAMNEKIKNVLYNIMDEKKYITQNQTVYEKKYKRKKKEFTNSHFKNLNSISSKEKLLDMKFYLNKKFSLSPSYKINSYNYKPNNLTNNNEDDFYNEKGNNIKINLLKKNKKTMKKSQSNKNTIDYNKNNNIYFYINMKIRGLLNNYETNNQYNYKKKDKKNTKNNKDNSLITFIKNEVKERRNYLINN
jgi:hypothetical protein